MFIDLVGSTALSGSLDPEEMNDLMQEYRRVCADVIRQYGGQIGQYLGDGLLVYFGYPISHEDDAQHAIHAALEIVQAISHMSERLVRSLNVRIGIHTGLAVVGHLGSDPNPMAISGETPNIAARLQTLAEPGTIVISAATFRLVEGFFICRSLGATLLKGLVLPIEVYLVVKESTIRTRFERAVSLGLTPLVGRKHELELLLSR